MSSNSRAMESPAFIDHSSRKAMGFPYQNDRCLNHPEALALSSISSRPGDGRRMLVISDNSRWVAELASWPSTAKLATCILPYDGCGLGEWDNEYAECAYPSHHWTTGGPSDIRISTDLGAPSGIPRTKVSLRPGKGKQNRNTTYKWGILGCVEAAIYMYVCMYVCMYVLYVCMCMYVCVCMYVYIYICIQYTPLSVDKWLVLCAPGNFIYFWLFRDLSNRTYSSTTRPANSSKSHITSYNVIWSASGCNWQRCNSNQLGQSWLTLWFWSSFMGLNHCNHSSLKFWQAWGAWGVH